MVHGTLKLRDCGGGESVKISRFFGGRAAQTKKKGSSFCPMPSKGPSNFNLCNLGSHPYCKCTAYLVMLSLGWHLIFFTYHADMRAQTGS
jgi:hypothetical protein